MSEDPAQRQPAPFPAQELREATADTEAHAAIADLHAELSAHPPDPARIEQHVHRLSGWNALVATVESWYLDPRTQLFIEELTAAGL